MVSGAAWQSQGRRPRVTGTILRLNPVAWATSFGAGLCRRVSDRVRRLEGWFVGLSLQWTRVVGVAEAADSSGSDW